MGSITTSLLNTCPVARSVRNDLQSERSLQFPYSHASGVPMDARQPEERQVKLRDLIEAMRRLRVAAHTGEPAGDLVTDARGAAVAILTPDGKFLSANRSAATLLGYTTGELVGKRLVDMA